jgi:copper homeostasis protein (lipoprotein)
MMTAAFALALATGARAEPLVLGPFSGVLPCADCAGISTRLTLTRKGDGWAEGTYRLEETYLGRGGPHVTTGDWTTLRGDAVDGDAVVYELNPDDPAHARRFVKVGERKLLPLDAEMRPLAKLASLVWRRGR